MEGSGVIQGNGRIAFCHRTHVNQVRLPVSNTKSSFKQNEKPMIKYLFVVVLLGLLPGGVLAQHQKGQSKGSHKSPIRVADSGMGKLASDLMVPGKVATVKVVDRVSKAIANEVKAGKFLPKATDPSLWLLDVQRVSIGLVRLAMSARASNSASMVARTGISMLLKALDSLKADRKYGASVSQTRANVIQIYGTAANQLKWPANPLSK